MIRRWRAAWRDLPADPEDYAGAAKALDRDGPAVHSALLDYSERFADP